MNKKILGLLFFTCAVVFVHAIELFSSMEKELVNRGLYSGGLCYTANQAKPVFGMYIAEHKSLTNKLYVMITTYGKQRLEYIGNDAQIDGDIVESYTDIPTFDKVANPKQGKYMKIKLENYFHPSDDDPHRAKTPQWLGKTLEFKRMAVPQKWTEDFNPHDPNKRRLSFTVTVDGKTTYQCGENPPSDSDTEPNG